MQTAREFLERYNMYYAQTDYDGLISRIIDEMIKAREAKVSSLSAIPCYLDLKGAERKKRAGKVIAIDAGGTNLRTALVEFSAQNDPVIIKQDKYLMPGQNGKITSVEFFNNLGKIIDKASEGLCEAPEYIGLSFAYKGDITPSRDFIVYKMCKEVDIEGIDGQSLTDGINAYYKSKGKRPKAISAINDSAATLIGTIPTKSIMEYGSCIGLIVGTGFNLCYRESSKNLKLSPLECGCDIVVCETGYFDKISQGVIDETVDKNSQMPKDHYFEKMISGRYLPEIFTECINAAVNEGIISSPSWQGENIDGKFLDKIVNAQPSGAEAVFIKEVCEAIITRAAMYCAAAVSAAVILSINDNKTAAIVPEGSTVLKLTGFMPVFKKMLDEKLTTERGISYDIFTEQDSVIKGAAKSVIM